MGALLPLILIVIALLSACAYIFPASWRAFRADPEDAAPAITRALDAAAIPVASFDPAKRQITTSWVQSSSGVSRSRERYVVTWEKETKDPVVTVRVRHEAQDQDANDEGRPAWGAVYHDGKREEALLDRIQKEIQAQTDSPPATPEQ